MKKKTLSKAQKKRIIQWEIPHLISLIAKEHKVVFAHLILPLFTSAYQKDWFAFGRKLAFPLFLEEQFLGILLCSRSLSVHSARKIRISIDHYLQKQIEKPFSLYRSSHAEETNKLNRLLFQLEKTGGKQIKRQEDFLESTIVASRSYREKGANQIHEKTDQYFPLLLRQNKKEEVLKIAHDLYLKTTDFAFLNTEDLKWKKKVFQEMQGVFVCVPSFRDLSPFQKKVLKEDLVSKKLSCKLVLGFSKKDLTPKQWLTLFPSVL